MKASFRCVFPPRVAGLFTAVLALALLAAVPGLSQTQEQYPIADISIALPPPPGLGLVEMGNDRNLFDPAVPDSNRLLAGYVPGDKVAQVRSAGTAGVTPYALVEVLRSGETMTISEDDFKSMADSISKEVGAMIDSSFQESQDEFNRKMKAMNLNIQATYGKPVMLGTFFFKTDAWSFGMMAPVTINGTTTDMVVGTVLLRVKSHVIFAYFYDIYKDDGTPGQVRAESEQWADAILAANQQP